ncbi:peptidase M50 [Candidatus Woesearchaeota archaeon]|nr:MAG: peptidase M50 [Candidatus Woesearchaeota archaeon]
MRFKKKELKDLAKTWLAVATVFSIAYSGLSNFISFFWISLASAGVAVVVHELAHKWLAQKYGCKAQFKSHDGALIFSIALSTTGIILLAPGGVLVSGASRDQNGKIALAGPLSNIVLSLISLALFIIAPSLLFSFSFKVNALFAMFNLLPVRPLDGSSVFEWNKIAWGASMAAASVVFFLTY